MECAILGCSIVLLLTNFDKIIEGTRIKINSALVGYKIKNNQNEDTVWYYILLQKLIKLHMPRAQTLSAARFVKQIKKVDKISHKNIYYIVYIYKYGNTIEQYK